MTDNHYNIMKSTFQRTTSGRIVGFGDAVLDAVSSVSFETLQSLEMQAGGSVAIPRAELERLLSIDEIKTNLFKVPGGSAANVMKCIAGLRAYTPDEDADISFIGMVGQDAAGEEYKTMLQSHGVKALLPECHTDDAATAACICLISPDGQRTMRTYLGAAQELKNLHQIPKEAELHEAGLVHFEGYSLYKPAVTLESMRAARAAGAVISLDLASFEVVRGCWEALKAILSENLVTIAFCNEDEAGAVCKAEGLLDDATATDNKSVIVAAQKYLLEFVDFAVMTCGKLGCVVGSAEGERVTAPAENVQVVDTVGAGDFFSAGFLHAWILGAPLQACAACGCASGAAAVQASGADIGEEGMRRLRAKVEGIITDGQNIEI